LTITILRGLLLTVFLSVLLGFLVYRMPYGGDAAYVIQLVERDWYILMHSPFSSLIHKFFYWSLNPLGVESWQAIALSSGLAGALTLQLLWRWQPHWMFLAMQILSGSFLVFAGHVENYAWFNFFLLLSFYYVYRHLENSIALWPALLCFFTACGFHMMGLFYLPGYLWLIKKKSDINPFEFILPFAVLLLALLLNFILPHKGLNIGLNRLIPIAELTHPGHHFTLFSVEHLKLLLQFYIQAGLFALPLTLLTQSIMPGLPIAWLIILIRVKSIQQSIFFQFLLVQSITGLIWTTVWHPDLGKLDWDLFGQPYIIIHCLAGWLICDWWTSRKKH